MDIQQQQQQQQQQQYQNKDISKLFQLIRTKLNEKEKELLELQRANPCLSAPSNEQIMKIVDLISSIDLITQDGAFSFQSNSNETLSFNSNSICSTGIDSIKTLPSTNWLSQTNEHRLPMVSHLLSLPINAYVQSKPTIEQNSLRFPMVDELLSKPISAYVQPKSTSEENSLRLPMVDELLSKPISAYVQPKPTTEQNSLRFPMVDELLSKPISAYVQPKPTSEENVLRLPMVDELLSKPISAYVQPKSTSEENVLRLPMVDELFSMPINAFTSKANEENVRESSKSVLDNQSIYSKEHWIKRKSTNEYQSDFVHIDLDEYIEQSSEKMRRLHLEYLEAIEKLKTPVESKNSSNDNIQSLYPQIFQRIKNDLSSNK